MTAIAGLVGALPAGLERGCLTSLDGLRLYGSKSSIGSLDRATFGVNLKQILPEDQLDRQPYSNGRFLLVADIRLDNRDDLAAEIGISRAELARWADAELLFRAWSKWEHRCLERIVGDYAIAVWDVRSQELTLARDPVGQRPLFYSRIQGNLCFASMPSGILCHGTFRHDHLRIAQRLVGEENDSRRSYFDGISRLLSGETIVISADRTTATRWAPRTDELGGRATEDLVCEFRDRLDKSVAACLRGTRGIVASHLSSGYDSSAVTATAAMLAEGRELLAFTSAPISEMPTAPVRDRNVDESGIAARTAAFLGIEQEIVRTPEPLLDGLRDHTRYFQEPVRNLLNFGWYSKIERRAAERGAHVLLTGELGNLTISAGGLGELSEWIRRGAWASWLREIAAAVRRPDVRLRGALLSSFYPFMPARVTEQLYYRFLGHMPWRSASFVRQEVCNELPRVQREEHRSAAAQRLSIAQGFDAGVARKGALAKHGIDYRDPTADRRLIEFALRLPTEQLLHGGVYKPLARAALADRVPRFVIDLPTRGYQGADWVSRIDRKSALEIVETIRPNSTVRQVIDIPRLERAITDWPDIAEASASQVESFGRHLTNALAMGVFIIESGDGLLMGR